MIFKGEYFDKQDHVHLSAHEFGYKNSNVDRMKLLKKNLMNAHDMVFAPYGYKRLSDLIIQLHDHKGQLHVIWRDTKSYVRFNKIVRDAWSYLGECELHHFVFSREYPIASEYDGRNIFN